MRYTSSYCLRETGPCTHKILQDMTKRSLWNITIPTSISQKSELKPKYFFLVFIYLLLHIGITNLNLNFFCLNFRVPINKALLYNIQFTAPKLTGNDNMGPLQIQSPRKSFKPK